jgi:hypothetical protein
MRLETDGVRVLEGLALIKTAADPREDGGPDRS